MKSMGQSNRVVGPSKTGDLPKPDFWLEYERPHLYPKQMAAIFEPRRYSLIEASAQPLDTTIQTPSGPRSFGSLCVGDEVFTRDGSVTAISGIYPKGIQPVYRLLFSDGTSTRASGDHLWQVDHYRDGVKIVTTDKLLSLSEKGRKHFRFPIAEPLQYAARPVRIEPWLLGVLLGDGTLCGNALGFSSADPEIVERVERSIPRGYVVRKGGDYNYRIVACVRGAGYERPSIRFKADGYEVSVAGRYIGRRSTLAEAELLHAKAMVETYGEDMPEFNLRRELAALGLLGLKHNEKFIPELYMRNSIKVRQEILRGVMDTDGSGCSGNCAVIEQTSDRLAKNIEDLIRSLGGICRTTPTPSRGAGWKPSYRTNIKHKDAASLFWLKRKSERVASQFDVVRKLVSIERLEDAPVQCIAVDDPSQLYLTDDCIVTHNTKAGKTSGCIAWIVEQALSGREGWNYWWVAPVSDQAQIAFRRMRRSLPQDVYTANISLKTITLINGAVIWFKSADKSDSLYGEDVYGAVIDEASRTKEDSYIAIRTTLTYTKAPIRIIGNVRGRKNWFYKMSRKAERDGLLGLPGEMGYHKIVAGDAVAAGVLDQREIDEAREQMPHVWFRELYYAEASDDGGNPFGLQHIEAVVKPETKPGSGVVSNKAPRAWGWDFAKHRDYFVGIALDEDGAICRFVRHVHMPWGEVKNTVVSMTGNAPALGDSTHGSVGDPIVEDIQRMMGWNVEHGGTAEGCNFQGYPFTQSSKQRLMEGLAAAIQGRTVWIADNVVRQELEQFEFELTRGGVKYSAPEGYHDDCVCALALARMCFSVVPSPVRISADLLHRVAQMPRRRAH